MLAFQHEKSKLTVKIDYNDDAFFYWHAVVLTLKQQDPPTSLLPDDEI